jgi:hypothetical protein
MSMVATCTHTRKQSSPAPAPFPVPAPPSSAAPHDLLGAGALPPPRAPWQGQHTAAAQAATTSHRGRTHSSTQGVAASKSHTDYDGDSTNDPCSHAQQHTQPQTQPSARTATRPAQLTAVQAQAQSQTSASTYTHAATCAATATSTATAAGTHLKLCDGGAADKSKVGLHGRVLKSLPCTTQGNRIGGRRGQGRGAAPATTTTQNHRDTQSTETGDQHKGLAS